MLGFKLGRMMLDRVEGPIFATTAATNKVVQIYLRRMGFSKAGEDYRGSSGRLIGLWTKRQ